MKIRAVVILRMAVCAFMLNFGGMIGSVSLVMAADASFHGLVTDTEGKPIRGAAVSAVSGSKSIGRFTDNNGHYEIAGLQPGIFEVSVTAFGYARKSETRDAGKSGETNFALLPRPDSIQVSMAELLTYFPDNGETRFLVTSCETCHNLLLPRSMRGMVASEWQNKIREMRAKSIAGTGLNPTFTDAQLEYAGRLLEKYFGPDSPEVTAKMVKHVEPSEAALEATFYEYKLPAAFGLPHSIAADNHGNGWFAEYSFSANKFGKLNFATGEITEYPAPMPKAAPHSPLIDKDGRVWMPFANAKRLSYLDMETGKVTTIADPSPGAHTLAFDKDGNIWGSGGKGVYKFDKETQKFREYPGPVPKVLPEESNIAWRRAPGEPPPAAIYGGSYDVAVDSKNKVWYTQNGLGILVSLDQKTGQQQAHKIPGVPTSRGVTVDSKDNIWYSGWDGHKIVKFDQRTGQAKLYQPPTPFATPYGLVFDKNGILWFADYQGNNITRFDPGTEQFTEYPIPTYNAMPRFISVDDQGLVWFCEWWQSKVGVLVPGGNKPADKPSGAVASSGR